MSGETLKKPVKKEGFIGCKVDLEKEEEIKAFCEFRNWNLSAFVRQAIDESMVKVLEEEGK